MFFAWTDFSLPPYRPQLCCTRRKFDFFFSYGFLLWFLKNALLPLGRENSFLHCYKLVLARNHKVQNNSVIRKTYFCPVFFGNNYVLSLSMHFMVIWWNDKQFVISRCLTSKYILYILTVQCYAHLAVPFPRILLLAFYYFLKHGFVTAVIFSEFSSCTPESSVAKLRSFALSLLLSLSKNNLQEREREMPRTFTF